MFLYSFQGCTVFIAKGAEIVVSDGAELLVYGDLRNPVSFLPLDQGDDAEVGEARHGHSGHAWRGAAWGEIRVDGGGRALLMHAILSGGGAKDELKVRTHPFSQHSLYLPVSPPLLRNL